MKIEINEKKEKSGSTIVLFNGEATIYSVAALKNELSAKYNDMENIVFDFSGITKMDTAGFQLFYLIKKDATAKGLEMVYRNPSEEVKKIFDLYGESIQ